MITWHRTEASFKRSCRVVIVDTSNEIGGDGDVAHPAIGGARRMQVPDPSLQHRVMVCAYDKAQCSCVDVGDSNEYAVIAMSMNCRQHFWWQCECVLAWDMGCLHVSRLCVLMGKGVTSTAVIRVGCSCDAINTVLLGILVAGRGSRKSHARNHHRRRNW